MEWKCLKNIFENIRILQSNQVFQDTQNMILQFSLKIIYIQSAI